MQETMNAIATPATTPTASRAALGLRKPVDPQWSLAGAFGALFGTPAGFVFAMMIGIGLVPGAAAMAGLAGPLRLGYPVLCLVVGLLVWQRSKAAYLATLIVLFVMAPWVQRVIDVEAGRAAFKFVLLGPYMAGLPMLWTLLFQLDLRRSLEGRALVPLLLAIGYALLLSLVSDRGLAGGVDAVRWLIPLATVALILNHPEDFDGFKDYVGAGLLVLLPLVSVYAAYQFAFLPNWDREWLINSNAGSFGQPEPYLFRAFGTLNSTGSFAKYLAAGCLLFIAIGRPIALGALALSLGALMLTLVRAGWIAVAFGVGLLLLRAHPRVWLRVALTATAAILLASNLEMSADVTGAVADRLESFMVGKSDTSALDRLGTYVWTVVQLDQHPEGLGFGINANGMGGLRDLDSGVVEVFLVFGILPGAVWFAVYAWILRVSAVSLIRTRDPIILGSALIVLSSFSHLWLGTPFNGENGMMFWPFVGLLLANRRQADAGP